MPKRKNRISTVLILLSFILTMGILWPCGLAWAGPGPDVNITNDFTDPHFKQAIYTWLGQTPGTIIHKSSLTARMSAKQYTLDVSNQNIADLAGLQDFEGTGLTILKCQKNKLTTVPPLPSSLQFYYGDDNLLTSLPVLDSNLFQLGCANNKLTSLPTLPSGLATLGVTGNSLTTLPALPSNLKDLTCDSNQLTALPTLPSSLKTINCANNKLTSLPTLPSTLTLLYCGNNQLSSLPALPAGLTALLCYYNKLVHLPTLPATITCLRCSYNQLTSLPALPAALTELRCEQNQLTSLPALPSSLNILYCYENQINSMGSLPGTLKDFQCYSNKLISLPALPAGLQTLDCHQNNLLGTMSGVPATLTYLNCSFNQLTDFTALPGSMQTLNCACNYMDVYSNGTGSLKARLNGIVCGQKFVEPQYRVFYQQQTPMIIKTSETKNISSDLVRQEAAAGGINWITKGVPGTFFVFSSSNTAVATVDASTGAVTGHHPGSCNIFADLSGLQSTFTRATIPVKVPALIGNANGQTNPQQASKPDLILPSVDGPDSVLVGGSITINYTVKNQGSAPAGAFVVSFYISSDDNITGSDTYLGQRSLKSLAAGASSSDSLTVNLPNTLTPNLYFIGAVVDSTIPGVNEAVETNNVGYDPNRITIKKPLGIFATQNPIITRK
ncbi:MAG TPA: CARDB domain-containing protein [Syntrophomonadaceae bacterium]|nr:CARDB domain-containing protein [Syntrophomonadaceae bacterium]